MPHGLIRWMARPSDQIAARLTEPEHEHVTAVDDGEPRFLPVVSERARARLNRIAARKTRPPMQSARPLAQLCAWWKASAIPSGVALHRPVGPVRPHRPPPTPAPDQDRQPLADPGELAAHRRPGQDAGEWEIPRMPLPYERAVLAGVVVREKLRTTSATAVRGRAYDVVTHHQAAMPEQLLAPEPTDPEHDGQEPKAGRREAIDMSDKEKVARRQGAAVHDFRPWSRIYPATGREGCVPVAFVFTGRTAAQRVSRMGRLEQSACRYLAGALCRGPMARPSTTTRLCPWLSPNWSGSPPMRPGPQAR
ncbi:hypothetical protein [Streptomyces sp. UH6]|uniref:hypothetical protein n=1 Tax=Streptomyces sp. UH6 TaxID=2748379 RepID=UPI0015D474A7|nr:hypothetical protein [Streptomyces sp. UH6]NYV72893.1 hypothetical protein [Streptomyces sp. UH6]